LSGFCPKLAIFGYIPSLQGNSRIREFGAPLFDLPDPLSPKSVVACLTFLMNLPDGLGE
jgi:hypothetical protein